MKVFLVLLLIMMAVGACVSPTPTPALSSPATNAPASLSTATPLLPTPTPVAAIGPPATLVPEKFIQFAWFYKPPTNIDLETLAANYDTFILTHKDEEIRDGLRAYGVDAPFLQYLRFDAINDPASCEATPRGNQAAYLEGDFCFISDNHADWFLLNGDNQRLLTGIEGNYYRMNIASEGWREFYVVRANDMKEEFGWDGLFMDSTIGNTSTPQNEIEDFFAYVRNHYDGPLFANVGGMPNEFTTDYYDYLDGMMHEAWSLDWEGDYISAAEWDTHLQHAEAAQAAGKTLILVAQGDASDTQKLTFAFASYLLVAGGKASFRYGGLYREAVLIPRVDLGQPLGPRYLAGEEWRRDFANGQVIVNPNTHFAAIELATVSNVALTAPSRLIFAGVLSIAPTSPGLTRRQSPAVRPG
jgi:hypothetical protein